MSFLQIVNIQSSFVLTIDWDGEPSAFLIQSKNVVESYKKFFEAKWKKAKK